jgi:ABC-type bacteriocin/lantibiotic exporter with double-glycine peptidase domain
MIPIPLIQQTGATHCAAACLEMVYSAFGKQKSQDLIFQERSSIRSANPNERSIQVAHMVSDALDMGLYALAIKARDIKKMLYFCNEQNVPVILIQKLNLKGSREVGHCRVFSGLNLPKFIINDPLKKQPILMTPHDLQQYSQESSQEVIGNMMVAVSDRPLLISHCSECRTFMPDKLTCEACKKDVVVSLSKLLGCINDNCNACMWDGFGCPDCGKRLR